MPDDSHLSTIIFFSLGLMFVQFCFIFYLLIQRSAFIEYYVRQCENAKRNEDVEFQIRCHAASINAKQAVIDETVGFAFFPSRQSCSNIYRKKRSSPIRPRFQSLSSAF